MLAGACCGWLDRTRTLIGHGETACKCRAATDSVSSLGKADLQPIVSDIGLLLIACWGESRCACR